MVVSRVKTLVAMQLTNKKYFKEMKDWKKVFVYFMLRIIAVLIMTAVMYFVLYFFKNIMFLNTQRTFFLFFITVTQIVSIILNTNQLTRALYMNKDNQILFSFPVRYNEIFASKLIVFYWNEFVKNLYFMLPFLLAFGVFMGLNWEYFVIMPFVLVVLPLIPVLLGALLSLPYMYIRKWLQISPIAQFVFGMAVVGCVLYLIILFVQGLPVPLRLVAFYHSFINGVNDFMIAFNSYVIVYPNICNSLFAGKSFMDFFIMFGTIIALALLVYLIIMPFYFRIVSDFVEHHLEKKHTTKNIERGTFQTLLIKEIKLILRTPGRLLSTILIIITFPFLMMLSNSIFNAINTSSLGNAMVLSFNLLIGLVLLASSNSIYATSISSEGEEFKVLKTAPSQTYKITWAKMSIALVVTSTAIIFGFIAMLFVSGIDITNLILLFVMFLLLNAANLFQCFQTDILNPKLLDFAITGNVDTNSNIDSSMLNGILIALAFTAFSLFFFVDSIVGGWVRVLLVGVIYFVIRLFLYLINLKVYFKRIEG